jgi:hypothetical protein
MPARTRGGMASLRNRRLPWLCPKNAFLPVRGNDAYEI